MFSLPKLDYSLDSLMPYISAETMKYHYGKHHANYVKKLNELIVDSPYDEVDLETIIKQQSGSLFENAAQHWNHSLYWRSLSPHGGGKPYDAIEEEINKHFGDFKTFKEQFTELANNHFSNGWIWLSRAQNGVLVIETTHDADNPLVPRRLVSPASAGPATIPREPLVVCDLWEHSYYLDYRNMRSQYLHAFWNLINWELINERLA